MKEVINIQRDDFLWFFYKKAFLLSEKEIEAPRNLCQYVKTAGTGFGMWLNRELPLVHLWLSTVVVTAVAFLLMYELGATNAFVASVVTILVLVPMVMLQATTIVVTLYRLFQYLLGRSPLVILLLVVTVSIFCGYFAIQQLLQEGLPAEFYWFLSVLKWMVYVVILMLVLRHVVLPLLEKLPDWYIDKLISAFEKLEPGIDRLAGYAQRVHSLIVTLGHVIRAKKQPFCPPVNPPADFTPESKV